MTIANDQHPDYDIARGPFGGAPAWTIGAAAAALALVIAAALFSHAPSDPSFWNANGGSSRNWLGAIGANLSAGLFVAFGLAAWALPAGLALWAWRWFAGRVHWDFNAPARAAVSAIIAAILVPALFSAFPGLTNGGATGLGGWVGDRTMVSAARLFESWGSGAPYMLPGVLALLGGAAAFYGATGGVGAEFRAAARRIGRSWRDAFSREQRRTIGENAAARARDLTTRLRERAGLEPEPLAPDEIIAETQPAKAAAGKARDAAPGRDRTEPRQPKRKRRGASSGGARPALDLLEKPRTDARKLTREQIDRESALLKKVLSDYSVEGEVVKAHSGPVVTLHEFDPAAGTKASRVVGLADDIARSMSADSARVAAVRGRSVIGIELPNPERETVYLRELMEKVVTSEIPLPLALGKEIDGGIKIASLTRMPHLLVAGTTGSGKSVAINGMILSLLYRHTPEECRMIMIDPKMLELSVYDGIPHLLAPVVTDPKKAVMALKWVVKEMEERYQKMARVNVRGVDGYNDRMRKALERGEPLTQEVQIGFDADDRPVYETRIQEPEILPYIVVIVDEMADLMMVAGKEIEACIQRLAQMARAAGIHLITATQRPSVDVITGTIKANFPTRISFQVTSKIDSRTILGEQGAEQLLGRGDMLFMEGGGRITRVHGPFVSDMDVHTVASELRKTAPIGAPVVFEDETAGADPLDQSGGGGDGDDALYDQAVAIVARDRRATTSYIQRRLQIGYNRAARIMEEMEEQGVISPPNNAGKREVLIEER